MGFSLPNGLGLKSIFYFNNSGSTSTSFITFENLSFNSANFTNLCFFFDSGSMNINFTDLAIINSSFSGFLYCNSADLSSFYFGKKINVIGTFCKFLTIFSHPLKIIAQGDFISINRLGMALAFDCTVYLFQNQFNRNFLGFVGANITINDFNGIPVLFNKNIILINNTLMSFILST